MFEKHAEFKVEGREFELAMKALLSCDLENVDENELKSCIEKANAAYLLNPLSSAAFKKVYDKFPVMNMLYPDVLSGNIIDYLDQLVPEITSKIFECTMQALYLCDNSSQDETKFISCIEKANAAYLLHQASVSNSQLPGPSISLSLLLPKVYGLYPKLHSLYMTASFGKVNVMVDHLLPEITAEIIAFDLTKEEPGGEVTENDRIIDILKARLSVAVSKRGYLDPCNERALIECLENLSIKCLHAIILKALTVETIVNHREYLVPTCRFIRTSYRELSGAAKNRFADSRLFIEGEKKRAVVCLVTLANREGMGTLSPLINDMLMRASKPAAVRLNQNPKASLAHISELHSRRFKLASAKEEHKSEISPPQSPRRIPSPPKNPRTILATMPLLALESSVSIADRVQSSAQAPVISVKSALLDGGPSTNENQEGEHSVMNEAIVALERDRRGSINLLDKAFQQLRRLSLIEAHREVSSENTPTSSPEPSPPINPIVIASPLVAESAYQDLKARRHSSTGAELASLIAAVSSPSRTKRALSAGDKHLDESKEDASNVNKPRPRNPAYLPANLSPKIKPLNAGSKNKNSEEQGQKNVLGLFGRRKKQQRTDSIPSLLPPRRKVTFASSAADLPSANP